MFFLNKHQPAVLAQLVERMAFNHVVVGSIPTDGDSWLPIILVFFLGPLSVSDMEILIAKYKTKIYEVDFGNFLRQQEYPTLKFVLY